MIVIQVEVAYEDNEAGVIRESIGEVLEVARGQAAARVVGSYHQPGTYQDAANEEWTTRGVSRITLPVSSEIEVD